MVTTNLGTRPENLLCRRSLMAASPALSIQKGKLVDNQFDSLRERHATAVASAGLDADQYGVRSRLRGLHRRRELEAMRGKDAVVVIGCRDQGWRIG